MKRIIEQTEDGSATLFVPELNEHYHSVKGAYTESTHIFIHMGLDASAVACPHVLEIGFGTGLNALLTLEAAQHRQQLIRYTGLELYPLCWDEIEVLHYSNNPLFKTLHQVPWGRKVEVTPYFTLCKLQVDVCRLAASADWSHKVLGDTLFTHIYFDAFAPDKQPEMWNESIFRWLFLRLVPGGILTTYCAKGVVRRLLQSIGFHVERLPGPPGGKREILRATKQQAEVAVTE